MQAMNTLDEADSQLLRDYIQTVENEVALKAAVPASLGPLGPLPDERREAVADLSRQIEDATAAVMLAARKLLYHFEQPGVVKRYFLIDGFGIELNLPHRSVRLIVIEQSPFSVPTILGAAAHSSLT